MGKVDNGEFNNSGKEDNIFSEYKPFSAEKYYSPEIAKTPKELPSFNESFNNDGGTANGKHGRSVDAKEIQKQYDKLKESDTFETGDPSATSMPSTAQTAANTTQTAGGLSGGAATAGGATAGATVAVAVVVVSAAISGGFISDFNSHIDSVAGMDYVSISVNMDELLSQADKRYNLTSQNFSIELDGGDSTRKIQLTDGIHSYLITGLQPQKTYTYNLICNNPPPGSNANCYSQAFTTLGAGEPVGVYDELNSFVTYDEVTQTATVGYSVYVSDYSGVYDNYAFYICSTEQTNFSSVNHVIYADEALGEDNYFKGEATGITYNELYLYVVGGYGAEAVELFSLKMTLDLPEEWQTANKPAFEIAEGEETVTTLPDGININGRLNTLNENFTYFAYVTQYNEDGTALVERQEIYFDVDTADMTYTIESMAYYGVKSFKYVIYTLDEGGNELTVYDSGEKQFTASQQFGATYTKVQPADAVIEYSANGVTITVDPGFTSDYGNYEYKLVVTNSTGEVFGEYRGTGEAVIAIDNYVGLDEINFTYYDLGTFADGETELASHTTEGVAFCMPTLTLGTEYGFDGQYFTLYYTCGMDYDYAQASIDIEVSDGTNTYTKHVDSVSASGIIVLDNITGEPGNVTVSATLNFTDNQSDGAVHSLTLARADYAMNYRFEVTEVVADISGYADLSGMPSETMLIELNFDYLLPDGYKIRITDEANSLDRSTELVKTYSFSDLSRTAEVNLTIQVTDAEGNAFKEAKTFNISKAAAEAEYVTPTIYCLNPGDAVVTYNDDGTINVYRNLNFSCGDERVYYNAMLRAGYYNESYDFIETYRFDIVGRDKYAVIEDIPNENYTLHYYQMFDYNGVSYIMYIESPSGSVENVYKDDNGDGYEDFAIAVANVAGGRTTIAVNVSGSGQIANRIIVDGIEYQFDNYSDENQTEFTVTIDGEIDLTTVTEVTVFFTIQGYNYDEYGASGEITMKASKYGKHTIKVSTVEA